MKSAILLELARIAGFVSRRIENKLLAASWNAQRASGKGPWEIAPAPSWVRK